MNKMIDLTYFFIVSFLILLICWVCVVNLFFIIYFIKKRLFRPPEIFIFSLAVADFFIGSIIMPSGLCKVRISQIIEPDISFRQSCVFVIFLQIVCIIHTSCNHCNSRQLGSKQQLPTKY